jgi:hypothetical protein
MHVGVLLLHVEHGQSAARNVTYLVLLMSLVLTLVRSDSFSDPMEFAAWGAKVQMVMSTCPMWGRSVRWTHG